MQQSITNNIFAQALQQTAVSQSINQSNKNSTRIQRLLDGLLDLALHGCFQCAMCCVMLCCVVLCWVGLCCVVLCGVVGEMAYVYKKKWVYCRLSM